MEKEYYTVTQTAKMIRKTLKLAWPKIKFSVRSQSFAGGTAIDITWVDGPNKTDCETLISPYQSGGFDGSIDMAYSISSWLLPNGRAVEGHSQGTQGSGGYVAAYTNPAPSDDAILVSFGAKYISFSRELSDKYVEGAENIWDKLSGNHQCDFINQNQSGWHQEDPKMLWASKHGLKSAIPLQIS